MIFPSAFWSSCVSASLLGPGTLRVLIVATATQPETGGTPVCSHCIFSRVCACACVCVCVYTERGRDKHVVCEAAGKTPCEDASICFG